MELYGGPRIKMVCGFALVRKLCFEKFCFNCKIVTKILIRIPNHKKPGSGTRIN